MHKKGIKRTNIFTDEAVNRLIDRLATPLQFEQHLRLAFDETFRAGQKPVTAEIIEFCPGQGYQCSRTHPDPARL